MGVAGRLATSPSFDSSFVQGARSTLNRMNDTLRSAEENAMSPSAPTKNRLRFTDPFLTRSGVQSGTRRPANDRVQPGRTGGTRA